MGSRRAPRHGGGLRLEALSGGEVQGAARHQALGDGMSGSWLMAYKLLEAAVIVDLCSNAGSHVRRYLKTKMQHWLQWSRLTLAQD